MASGGSRLNSGPKKNNHPTAFVGTPRKYEDFLASHADRIAGFGINLPEMTRLMTPLDCLMVLMKFAMAAALQAPGLTDEHQFAMECARHAAPFCHPRLSMALVSHQNVESRPETLSDDELEKLIRDAGQVLTRRTAVSLPLVSEPVRDKR